MNKTFWGALAAGTLVLAMAPTAFAASLSSTQISAIVGLLNSFGVSSETVASVQGILNGTGPSSAGGTGSTIMKVTPPGLCSFSTDLSAGSRGSSVSCLQNYLVANGCTIPGGITGTFGDQTRAAVICWQKMHGLPASGYFGSMSRGVYMGHPPTTSSGTGTGTGNSSTSSTSGSTGQTSLNTQQVSDELNAILLEMNGLDSDISNVDNSTSQNDDSDE